MKKAIILLQLIDKYIIRQASDDNELWKIQDCNKPTYIQFVTYNTEVLEINILIYTNDEYVTHKYILKQTTSMQDVIDWCTNIIK